MISRGARLASIPDPIPQMTEILALSFRIAFVPIALLFLPTIATAAVHRSQYETDATRLVVEVLEDDLVRFEISPATSPAAETLTPSPMVFKTDYDGPARLAETGDGLETADIRLDIDPESLCIRLFDKTKADAYLGRFCPKLGETVGLDIDPGPMRQVYGLGQEFKTLGEADGDWTTLGVREGMEFGNGFQGFQDAAVGNVQIPVYYALGSDNLNYALFADHLYRQKWDFSRSPWTAEMDGDRLQFYLITGPDLPDLRSDYLELTGFPPVPPRKAFGLWVSEFGYDNWEEVDRLRDGLQAEGFPVDGFVIDLNWFGGVALNEPEKSNMGRLNWDENQTEFLRNNPYYFPNPGEKVREYAADNLGLTVIEESYIANTTDTFETLPPELTVYGRTNGMCDRDNSSNPLTEIEGFWGVGRMVDWSNPEAGEWIHENYRLPNLSRLGITSHWTDLGEPETFDRNGCYEGILTSMGIKSEHPDIHNIYNLLWNRSIWEGYFNHRNIANDLGIINPRPFIVTRSGAAGTQRYGTAMWSGDIASNLESLATHLNAQMQMSFSGIDYYGSDIGGFRREVMPYNDKSGRYRAYEDEMYTQWFAIAAWLDVPVRPHADNEFVKVDPPYHTSPHLVGKPDSNLANLRQRYELIPYYYSLAYRAHIYGEPVIPPPIFYYQNDPQVRGMGNQKLIGRDILVGTVTEHGRYERDLYLPKGKWVNYHSDEWFDSEGEILENLPVYRKGKFRLPAFVRAGAILPQIKITEKTQDAFGRAGGSSRAERDLILRVYADEMPSSFILYEDDGTTMGYRPNGRPLYHHRTTTIRQQKTGNIVTVTVEPAVDVNGSRPLAGAVMARSTVVDLIVDGMGARSLSLNNRELTEYSDLQEFENAESGWIAMGNNRIRAKSATMNVYEQKTFGFDLETAATTTSVNFVCDNAKTDWGEKIYVLGNIPALGDNDPERAIALYPSIDYDYITNPPPVKVADPVGPDAPIWTGVVANLPPNTTFEWQCLRRSIFGTAAGGDKNTHTTPAAGYGGRSYGTIIGN